SNDLFFVCSLLEHIARKTKNHRNVVVNAIGKDKLLHIYDLADVYHSENIDKISDDLIREYFIETGHFDNIEMSKYAIPTIWDIGKVYKRLIADVSAQTDKYPVDTLIEVYNSWISRKIEDFNSSMYYENPAYIFQSYLKGDVY
ncbi:MAG: hypothetical protein LBU22_08285, partial [Dysgonamonadaceae bacterium]|nr:hypothetical protein [Dysgonamonadaceae bacterium]